MTCGQITDNLPCIAIIGIDFAKLSIRLNGALTDLFQRLLTEDMLCLTGIFGGGQAKSGKWMFSPSYWRGLQR